MTNFISVSSNGSDNQLIPIIVLIFHPIYEIRKNIWNVILSKVKHMILLLLQMQLKGSMFFVYNIEKLVRHIM